MAEEITIDHNVPSWDSRAPCIVWNDKVSGRDGRTVTTEAFREDFIKLPDERCPLINANSNRRPPRWLTPSCQTPTGA